MSKPARYVFVAHVLEKLAYKASEVFHLDLNRIYFNELIIFEQVYGRLWVEQKSIEMRLYGSKRDLIMPRNHLLQTLAHELAHLEFTGHGKKHKELTGVLFEYLKRQFKDFKNI